MANKIVTLENLERYHDEISQIIDSKQDVISDLETIREGANKGATALQEIPSEYITEADLEDKSYLQVTKDENGFNHIDNFIVGDPETSEGAAFIPGLGLSASSIWSSNIQFNIDNSLYLSAGKLVHQQSKSGDTFIRPLATEEYVGNSIKNKQDTISDLETIRSGAAAGATALQSFTETDPIFSASVAANIKESDITNWNSKTSNTGTIT